MQKSDLAPEGYRYGPRYRTSLRNVIRAIAYIARGKPRSLARDVLYAINDVPVPPWLRGEDRIPTDRPLIVVANHYERPGLWMAWPASLISHAIRERSGREVRWIAIEEWDRFLLWHISVPASVIRGVFHRAFSTYGIIAMPGPDAPPRARAHSMRAAAEALKQGDTIGLMPEGTVGPTPELLPGREGAGSFLLLLASGGAPVLPVGLFEEEEHLVANFGEPFELKPPKEVSREERDEWARHRVMLAIRDLLPKPLWGAYANAPTKTSGLSGD